MTDILLASATSYIIGVIICSSWIMSLPRSMFRYLVGSLPVIGSVFSLHHNGEPVVSDDDVIDAKEGVAFEQGSVSGYDFISCRLCVGFYISAAVCMSSGIGPQSFLAVYGFSYLMTKLEQP